MRASGGHADLLSAVAMRRPAGKKILDAEKAADPRSAHAFAIAYLARRDFSAADLRRKLKDRGFAESAIEPVLAELEASNVINDSRYGENVVAHRARRGQGPARIRQELKRSGLDSEAIQTTMDKAKDEGPDFIGLARAARARKFGPKLPTDWKERSRQARFLQYRGFSTDHIRAVLEGFTGDPVEVEPGDADPASEPEPT
ncbi:MAG TPA: regulatory protein RecX [Steroidobacteraceae bacterium]|nr:regulatory protein RecX [Steroidobacteraceae bacterium]